MSGCRRQAEPPSSRYFVHLDALLPLHPTWGQVVSLDKAVARFPATQAPPAPLEVAALPPPFAPPETVPANLVHDRQQRSQEDAKRYIDQLVQSLNQRTAETLRREERAEQKRLEAQLAAEESLYEAAAQAAIESKIHEIEHKIYLLGFKDVALQSQIRVFTDQALQDAQRQRAAVLAEIADLNKQKDALQQEALSANVRAKAAAEMKTKRQQAEAALAARMQKRREEMDQAVATQIAREKERLMEQPEPIPPLGAAPLPAAAPITPPAAPNAPSAFAKAGATVNAALMQQRAAWQSQRARLVAAIRADTAKATAQIARQQGWTLVPENASRAADRTELVARALRAQWQAGNP